MDHPESEISRICIACGLCCDGTLFGRVNLEESEDDPPTRFEFDIAERYGHRCFTQPCRQLEAGGCRAYTQRPVKCRDYACRSLQALKRGEIDCAELARRTALAREALAGLRALLEPGEDLPEARERWIALAKAPARTPQDAVFLVRYAALDRLLQRLFHKDRHTLVRDGADQAGPAMPG